ncbi:GNAT family N-acetyltransferase [filamentous cyanobacterium CCP3]|nr:GNAT family N-acetyltransferase [filamentous cyanobacterium CCP3]
METLSPLTVLQPTQFDAATEVLCAAFADDPLFNYLVPADVGDRQGLMTDLFRMLLRCGGDHGYGLTDTDGQTLKGVAIWMPPGRSVDLIDLLLAGLYELPFRLPWQYLPRWQAALALDREHHQAMPMPHWYLMLLAVSPRFQRQGVGHQLMQPGLEGSDRTGSPCYLETSTEGAVRFYRRHGFEIVKTGPFGEQVPLFWTLRRG